MTVSVENAVASICSPDGSTHVYMAWMNWEDVALPMAKKIADGRTILSICAHIIHGGDRVLIVQTRAKKEGK